MFTGGKDGVFADWGSNRSVMSHSEGILCCCSSEEMNVAVSCGYDNVMVIMTASPLKFVRAVEMNLPPETVAQTVSIGHNGTIAVVSGHQSANIRGDIISLYTVNGIKYAEEKIGSTAISVIVSHSGSVSIAVATYDHAVMLYSGSNLKLTEFVCRCESEITKMDFDYEKQSLHIIAKTGKITVCTFVTN